MKLGARFYKMVKAFALVWIIAERGDIGAPIIISRDNIILDGNSRLRLAKELGFDKVSIVRIDADVEYINPNELIESY